MRTERQNARGNLFAPDGRTLTRHEVAAGGRPLPAMERCTVDACTFHWSPRYSASTLHELHTHAPRREPNRDWTLYV